MEWLRVEAERKRKIRIEKMMAEERKHEHDTHAKLLRMLTLHKAIVQSQNKILAKLMNLRVMLSTHEIAQQVLYSNGNTAAASIACKKLKNRTAELFYGAKTTMSTSASSSSGDDQQKDKATGESDTAISYDEVKEMSMASVHASLKAQLPQATQKLKGEYAQQYVKKEIHNDSYIYVLWY